MRVKFYPTTPAMIAATAALSLSACVPTLTTENVQSTPTDTVCANIVGSHVGNSPASVGDMGLAELKRRGLFTPRELDAIRAGKIYVGMSEAAMYCSIGAFDYGVNTTTTAAGVTKQYLVGDGTYAKRIYVYTTNGRVSAVQS